MHRITQKKVAIKILDKNKIESKDDLERILREMEILTEMDQLRLKALKTDFVYLVKKGICRKDMLQLAELKEKNH